MIDLSLYDYAVFDCDGVILDSNKLKSRSFAQALPNEPQDIVAKFVEYHKKNGGISRYKKFRYYFEEIKKSTSSKEETLVALNLFASLVRNGLLECEYVSGVLEFLNNVKHSKKPLFVVSGSDENELKEVFLQRGILHFFNHVYGSPINKNENTRMVTEFMGPNKKGLFFGDSESDYYAAIKYELDFVFVKGLTEWEDGNQININENNLVINDFTEIIL